MNAFVSAIKLKGISTISRLESVFLKGPMRAAITLTVVRLGTSGTLMSAVVCPCLLARKAIALIPRVKVRASTYALASKMKKFARKHADVAGWTRKLAGVAGTNAGRPRDAQEVLK